MICLHDHQTIDSQYAITNCPGWMVCVCWGGRPESLVWILKHLVSVFTKLMIHVAVGNSTKILCLDQNFRKGGYNCIVKKPLQFCNFSVNISRVELLTSSWHSVWWQISQTTVLYLLFSALPSLWQFGWGRLSLVVMSFYGLSGHVACQNLPWHALLMPK